jgi:hypothetical protein
MKTFKVHWIYILILGLGLSILAYTSTRELIDPTYHIVSRLYLPRPVLWCFVVYCWYKFLTTAYKVEIDEQRSIRTISLTGSKKIILGDVEKIEERMMFIQVVYSQGTVSISTLIDGISNVKGMLKSFISN